MAVKRLGQQLALHTAQVNSLSVQVDGLDQQKAAAMRSKNIALAKTKVKEKHKLITQRGRFEQLAQMCQRMLDNIQNGNAIRETVGVLNEVQLLFKGVQMDDAYSKIGELTDSMGDFQGDLAGITDMMQDSAGATLDDADLEAELEEMMQESEGEDQLRLGAQMPRVPSSTPGLPPAPPQAPMTRTDDVTRRVAEMYSQ